MFEEPRIFFAKEKIACQGSWGKSKSQALKTNQFRLLTEAQASSLGQQWYTFAVLIAYPYFVHSFTYSLIDLLIFLF